MVKICNKFLDSYNIYIIQDLKFTNKRCTWPKMQCTDNINDCTIEQGHFFVFSKHVVFRKIDIAENFRVQLYTDRIIVASCPYLYILCTWFILGYVLLRLYIKP